MTYLTVGKIVAQSTILGGIAECAGQEKGVVEIVEACVAGTGAFDECKGGVALYTLNGTVAGHTVGHAVEAGSCTNVVVLTEGNNTARACYTGCH